MKIEIILMANIYIRYIYINTGANKKYKNVKVNKLAPLVVHYIIWKSPEWTIFIKPPEYIYKYVRIGSLYMQYILCI